MEAAFERECLLLSLDFLLEGYSGTTGTAHFIQTYLAISLDIRTERSLANHRSMILISRYRINNYSAVIGFGYMLWIENN